MAHDPNQLLAQSRSGDTSAIGALLRSYTAYLTIIARSQLGRRLQVKLDADDLVQETFLQAHRQFTRFRGTSEMELISWLKQILSGQIALALRRYLGTRARDMHLERHLSPSRSPHLFDRMLISAERNPYQQMVTREEALKLAQALTHLEHHYREALVLRHIEQLSFAEVASRMHRTPESVQKLCVRALGRLRQALAP